MKFQGAVIEEQGVRFTVVKVDKDVFEIPGRARDEMILFQRFFPRMAVVFVAAEPGKDPNFYGRPDIVKAMMGSPVDDIEWKEFAFEEPETSG
jgi:hypothetical protein